MTRPSLALVRHTEPAGGASDALVKSLERVGVLYRTASTDARLESERNVEHGASVFGWLKKWLGYPDDPKVEPAPPPEAIPTAADDARTLLSILAQLPSESGASYVERERAKSRISALAAKLGHHLVYEGSSDDRFHRVTLKDIRFSADAGKLDYLDLSGLRASVALRLENCLLDVLDLSYAQLHSVDIKGCRPADDSPFQRWGMRLFAQELKLDGEFFLGRSRARSRILMLDGREMRARQIQIVDGTEFMGGALALEIWNRLLSALRQPAHQQRSLALIDQGAGLDIGDLIATHTIAARDVLKTIALFMVETEVMLIAVRAAGIIDLHDARVGTKLFIAADEEDKIERFDFVTALESEIDGLPLSPNQREQLFESAQFLSGWLSPALDLGGLSCSGEIRFDGPERRRDRKKPVLENEVPVKGHINLSNARCRVFTDDGAWLDRANRERDHSKRKRRWLTFGLNSFHYEFFGQDPRLLFDSDPEFDRRDWFGRPNDNSAATKAIERQSKRRMRFGQTSAYGDSSLKLVGVDRELVEQKLEWLEAAVANSEAEKGLLPDAAIPGFDAQPWTHCARVFRQAGFRQLADTILYHREARLDERSKRGGRWDVVLGISLLTAFFSCLALTEQTLQAWAWKTFLIASSLSFVLWQFGPDGAVRRLFRRVLALTAGYGFQLERALAQSIVIVVLATALFWGAHESKYLIMNPAANNDGAAWPSRSPPLAAELADISAGTPSAAVRLDDTPTIRLTSGQDYRDCNGYDRDQCAREKLNQGLREDPSSGDGSPPARETKTTIDLSHHTNIVNQSGGGGPYPDFNPFLFTLDLFVPFVDFGQANYWIPGWNGKDAVGPTDPPKGAGLFAVWVAYFSVVALGWLYTTVLVAGFTGLLDRKE